MKVRGKRILVVDDEPPIQRMLRRSLSTNGYDVMVAANGEEALEIVPLHKPDLILLDLCLPGEVSGFDVCKQVRQWAQTPIIVLSAKTEEKQKVQALDLGADDYLTKPFSVEELLARVRACLRRAGLTESTSEQSTEILRSDDGYFAGKVLTHRALLRAVWGPEYGEEADYLRVYVRQLRLKVEVNPSQPRYILTEPGIGYVFRSNADEQRE